MIAESLTFHILYCMLIKSSRPELSSYHLSPIYFVMIPTMNNDEQVLSFIVEWFDPVPEVIKKYLLRFYDSSNAVEMKEVASGRKFLKRTKIDSSIVSRKDFFLGATVIIFGRDLKVVDYGDDNTRSKLDKSSEKSICILLPSMGRFIGTIVSSAENEGNLTISDLQAFFMQVRQETMEKTAKILGLKDSSDLKSTLRYEVSDPNASYPSHSEMNYCIAVEFRGKNAITTLKEALTSAKDSIPAIQDQLGKTIFVSPNSNAAILYREHFLSRRHSPLAKYSKDRSTCCVIKPHIIKERKVGSILDDIISSRRMDITAMQVFHLDRIRAQEFYEVYKGAVKEYNSMVDELTSGPALAMEISAGVQEFRNHVGPWDVEMAKSLRNDSIRARFGSSLIQNAVHCTDLPEDNISELTYFFDILDSECRTKESTIVQ